MTVLTDRQREVLDYVSTYTARHKYPPSRRDIAAAFGITVRAANDHVKACIRKGYMRCKPYVPRSLAVVDEGE